MQEIYDFIKKCGWFMLATVDGDKARVRPLGCFEIYNGKCYIQTGKVKDFSKQMQANPNIELCACSGGEWLRMSGKVVRDEDVAVKEFFLEKNPELKNLGYDAHDDNMEVLYIDEPEAVLYSFTAEPKKLI